MNKLRFGAVALLLALPILVSAHWGGGNRTSNHSWHSQSQRHENRKDSSTPLPAPLPSGGNTHQSPPPVVNSGGGEITIQAYVTGYSYYDNTPPGSADISNPVIHNKAGGVGTFADPITLATGHSLSGGNDTLDYKAGTRFYVPSLRRYFIVEDTCGDGNSPQNGPCHTGYQGHPWLDVWVGKGASKSASDACMNKITEVHTVIQNPSSGHPVVTGDIAANCAVY